MEILSHGGNLEYLSRSSGLPKERIVDFSANINPLGPPEWLRAVVGSTLESIVHYPDPDCTGLVRAAGDRYGVSRDEVLVGNGSTEIIHLLPRVMDVQRALLVVPTYSDYCAAVKNSGIELHRFFLQESHGFAPDLDALEGALEDRDLVFVCQPNNPTGLCCDSKRLRRLAVEHPRCTFVVDEAFRDFVIGMDSLTRDRPDNLVVLLSLTKIYAVPGLRLGLAIASAGVARSIRRLQPHWTVSTLAQAFGEAALRDEDYVARSRQFVADRRERLKADLESIDGLTVYPGRANFLLIRIHRGDVGARKLARDMLTDGIAVRVCSNFDGLDDRFLRVAVRDWDENARLCESLRHALGVDVKLRRERPTPCLMFQGTSSNAGKSVLTAALCRILLQDGLRVAPFKAQNMSLNSFVTSDGGEMGRAQVVQAQACRLEPDVRMNPILLKPNTDTGSQVIVMGKPVGNMDVVQYVRYKPTAFEAVKKAYDDLAGQYDALVLEGAGSPAEVNLKHHDIVNMQMARYARAPVFLVGDIDRGGVFASFVGTMEVLAQWERALVAGFVVNRFRGNADLLADAFDYTSRHTGRPVIGVVPYFHDLGLPEEDSVTFKEAAFSSGDSSEAGVEIAIIDLPHISNFTDFDALGIEPDVRLKKVRTASDLDHPDAIIIPGSKNVIGDLEYLRSRGLDRRIRELTLDGSTELVGICGGFQMIGSSIADPHGLESDGKTLDGLGLLDMTTVLALEKTLTRVTATHGESGLTVRGYEIHHGVTRSSGPEPLLDHETGESLGVRSGDGRLWGTYMHGIFDADEFRRWFIDRLRTRRGLQPKHRVIARYDPECALDRLADAVRNSLDMDFVYRTMGL